VESLLQATRWVQTDEILHFDKVGVADSNPSSTLETSGQGRNGSLCDVEPLTLPPGPRSW